MSDTTFLIWCLCIFTSLIRADEDYPLFEEYQVWSVSGITGSTVTLPCPLNPRTEKDQPKLILWYKKGHKAPIYSHDGRLATFQNSIQRSGRLAVRRNSANLTLTSLKLDDEGVFECRVDFFRSPTHTNFVNLTVIKPPDKIHIFDKITGHRDRNILGPYQEGESLRLSCLARGGSPPPDLTWWHGNTILYEASVPLTGIGEINTTQSDLYVENLGPEWHNRTITCSAANSRLVAPLVATVKMDMYLLPKTVTLTHQMPVMEGEGLRLFCSSTGSYPAAKLAWNVRGVALPPEVQKISKDGKETTSTLYLNVTRTDNNSEAKCRATNPSASTYSIFNTTFIDVHYTPTAKAQLGHSLRSSMLREGDDVYFECKVDSNPKAEFIRWYHEGSLVTQNHSLGVILSGDSLVLQKVNIIRAGRYKCSASNYLGTAMSMPVILRLKYKPECQTAPTTYFIYDTPINVTCTISSHPPSTKVKWRWNSGSDVITSHPFSSNLKRSSVSSAGSNDLASATLTVYPSKNPEDRELGCWSKNDMGTQMVPCTFSIKVAKMPAPLSSCRLANITASSLSLSCAKPEIDIMGTTAYTAEVYLDNSTLFANLTSLTPNFNVSRLDPNTSYQIKVYVSYGPVTSVPVLVSAYTSRGSKVDSVQKAGPQALAQSTNFLTTIILLVIVIIVLSALLFFGRFHLKRRRRRARDPLGDKEENVITFTDDENPDVVPATEMEGTL